MERETAYQSKGAGGLRRTWGAVARRVRVKLASTCGDTLVESLAALLIAALGAAALATMVTVATQVSLTSNNALQRSYAAEAAIAQQLQPSETKSVSIKLGDDASCQGSVSVNVFRAGDGTGFVRYEPV